MLLISFLQKYSCVSQSHKARSYKHSVINELKIDLIMRNEIVDTYGASFELSQD